MKRTGLPLFLFHHLWHASVSPWLPGAIPAAILSGGDPRPSRKTQLVPARLPYRGGGEERRKKMKKGEKACRSSLPLSSDGCVNRPTAASAPPQPRQWSNGGRAEGASRIECSHFRSCVKNSHHSVASVTSEESPSNGTGDIGDVYPRGGICAGCCCHGNAAFPPSPCHRLDVRMLLSS